MALRLTRWTPGREVLIRDEAWSLCCVLGYDTLSKQCPSLSTQEYKWGTSQLSEKANIFIPKPHRIPNIRIQRQRHFVIKRDNGEIKKI